MEEKFRIGQDGQVWVLRPDAGQWEKVQARANPETGAVYWLDDNNSWTEIPAKIDTTNTGTRGERSLMTERARSGPSFGGRGQAEGLFVQPNTEAETRLAGVDMGVEDIVYGAGQLTSRLTGYGFTPYEGSDRFGWPGVSSREQIDQAVIEREQNVPGEGGGRLVGNILSFGGPGGAGVKLGTRIANRYGLGAIRTAAVEGAVAGAAEGALMPVTDPQSFYSSKAGQVAAGTALGTGLGAGADVALRAGTGVVNTPRYMADMPGRVTQQGGLRRTEEGLQRAQYGQQLADELDIPMTPGQRSGSATQEFLEQRARESFMSRTRIAEADMQRAERLKQAITEFKGEGDSVTFARRVQSRVTEFTRDLAKKRSQAGRQMYGEIEQMANGAPVVQPRNYYDTLVEIYDRGKNEVSGDWKKLSDQAKKMLEVIDETGGFSSSEALNKLQNLSPYSGGSIFDDIANRNLVKAKQREMYEALMKDLDETAAQGGTLGDKLREANAVWREYSSQLDSIGEVGFKKIVGEEIANELFQMNTKSPTEVMNFFRRVDPTQARHMVKFMAENMPEELAGLRAAVLDDALEAAMEAPPSVGLSDQFSPNGFLRALGLTGNKTGAQSRARLQAIFGGSQSAEWQQLNKMIDAAKILSSTEGKNFSGTAEANRFWDVAKSLLGGVWGAVKALGGAGVELVTLRRLANSMDPIHPEFGRVRVRPLRQLPGSVSRYAPPTTAVVGTPQLLDEES